MGQEESVAQPHSARNYNTRRVQSVKPIERVQHEGVLKLRSTPFANCIQIDSGGSPLFLQNAQISLQELLDSRLYTNRLFPYEDVKKLIQNIVYTLAYFQDLGVPYRDLCPQNIYYCGGQFKLLPNQLIQQTLFQRAINNFYHKKQAENEQFIILSPEMIIGLRYKQKDINDLELLNKSNVFNLGMILLEACTMLPASQCYHVSSYDIYNNVISERLELAQQHYDVKIVRIIANMIDYDYSERMLMKDIAIWINREFNETSQDKSLSEYQSNMSNKSKNKSKAAKSRIFNQQENQIQNTEKVEQIKIPQNFDKIQSQKSFGRTNLVYINKYNDLRQEEEIIQPIYNRPKNSIYLNSKHKFLQTNRNHQGNYQGNHQGNYQGNHQGNHQEQFQYSQYPEYQKPEIKTNKYKCSPQLPTRKDPHTNYGYRQEPRYQPNRTQIRDRNPSKSYTRQTYQPDLSHQYKLGEITREDRPPTQPGRFYCHQDLYLKQIQNESTPSRHILDNPYTKAQKPKQNKYTVPQTSHKRCYPSISELQNISGPIHSQTKRMNLHEEVGKKRRNTDSINLKQRNCEDSYDSKQSESKSSVNDGSINRIKLQIQKSRKLIEEFRKSEGIAKF